MATFTTTAKYALRWLTGSSAVSDVDLGFQSLAEDIDALMMGRASGTVASLPAAGKEGRVYRATDTGQLFFDTGTTWVQVPRVMEVAATAPSQQSINSIISTDLTGASVSLTLPSNGGLVELYMAGIGNASATGSLHVYLDIDGSLITQVLRWSAGGSTNMPITAIAGVIDGAVMAVGSPWTWIGTPGAHTFKLKASSDSGTGQVQGSIRARCIQAL